MDLRKRRINFSKSSKKELLKELRKRKSFFLVAESENKIIGYIRGTITEDKEPFFKTVKTGSINSLVVSKKYRGKGISSKLNKEMKKLLKENKCSYLSLGVIETTPAFNIYKKWGYKSFNRHMIKKL
jgi:ribosomal protein S18 acetylase RimI-like enzyme